MRYLDGHCSLPGTGMHFIQGSPGVYPLKPLHRLVKTASLNPHKTLAILVGISRYEEWEPIEPAERNVSALAEVLADPEIFGLSDSRIHKILDGNSARIKRQIQGLLRKSPSQGIETLLFYFTGHGYKRPKDGRFFLVAPNTYQDLVNADGSTGIARG